MRLSLLLAVAAVCLAGFAPAPFPKARKRSDAESLPQRLEGVWTVESCSIGGQVQGGPGPKWETVRIEAGLWSQGCKVAGCSTALVMMCASLAQRPKMPRSLAKTAPLRAWLLASLPPPVKTISSGLAPSKPATCWRAWSTAWWAVRPKTWLLEGLPKCSRR